MIFCTQFGQASVRRILKLSLVTVSVEYQDWSRIIVMHRSEPGIWFFGYVSCNSLPSSKQMQQRKRLLSATPSSEHQTSGVQRDWGSGYNIYWRSYLCPGLRPASPGSLVYPLGVLPPAGKKIKSIMQSEKATANTPRHLLSGDNDSGHASISHGPQPTAGDNVPPLGVDLFPFPQPELTVSQNLTGDELIERMAREIEEEEDVDVDAWTQIPGPSDEDMSDSDDSVAETPWQYQIPRAIQEAEQSTTHQPSGSHTVPEVHGRYKGFALLLCKETATDGAVQHVLEGLPIAIDTARSVRLDEDAIDDEELDLYAFALVIHIWQIVCIRMQHGQFPPDEGSVSLCLSWTTYFLSAHTLVKVHHGGSEEDLRCAVQYWEKRLRSMGGGNRWMEAQWATDIPQDDLEAKVHRNETADRYLEALAKYGKEGLTMAIIKEEMKGESTQLRAMTQQSPDGMKNARRQITSMLYSMDTSLLKAMIQGQLPRLAAMESGTVYQALRKLNGSEYIQPGTYMNCICDEAGLSPTPEQWRRVSEQMLKYVQYGDEHNDLAEQIDQHLHPKYNWPKDLAHKGLRRYTEWRSYTENGSTTPDSVHRKWVQYFVDQLKKRMEGQPIHAPLSVPVVEIGFSNDPDKRLRQHRHHESSNYLMNLAEAVFDVEYSGSFRLQQMIVFACYRSIQTWLSEIVVTQLAQGYVEGGAGFSHEPAGRSNTSSNKKVPIKVWTMFEAQIYADGTFEKEVDANTERRLAAQEQREQRQRERERGRRLHVARVTHLRNLIALEEARKNLYDAMRRF